MNIERITHLLRIASHRMKVGVVPDDKPQTEPQLVKKECIALFDNPKKLKKYLAMMMSEGRTGSIIGLALAYEHSIKHNLENQSKYIRACFSSRNKAKFLAPVDAFWGKKEYLKESGPLIGCGSKKEGVEYSLPPSVGYALLSQHPQTIQWALSSYFKVDLPLLSLRQDASNKPDFNEVVIGDKVFSSRSLNMMEFSNGVVMYRNRAVNLFFTILEEKSPSNQDLLLSYIPLLPSAEMIDHFEGFWKRVLHKKITQDQGVSDDFTHNVIASLAKLPLEHRQLLKVARITYDILSASEVPFHQHALDAIKLLSPLFENALSTPNKVALFQQETETWEMGQLAVVTVVAPHLVSPNMLAEVYSKWHCDQTTVLPAILQASVENWLLKEEVVSSPPQWKASKPKKM